MPIHNFNDLTGRTFGRLLVLSRAGSKGGRVTWNCKCECGTTCVAVAYGLTSGNTNSCGCRRSEQYAAPRSHGMTKTPTYASWAAMKTRCGNPKVPSFANYGGRGITMCERWKKFENFLADMGERPSVSHSIDRIDVNGNYEPDNCRWATAEQQMSNTTRSIHLEYKGLNLTLSEWSRRTGIDTRTLSSRVSMGWSTEETLSLLPRYGLKRVPQEHKSDGTFVKSRPA